MKRSFYFSVAVIALAAASLSAQSQTQSLGDYARAVKKAKSSSQTKQAPKVYDNDNLPQKTPISVVGDAGSAPADQSADASKNADGTPKQDAAASDKKKEPELRPGQPVEERQKALDAWKDKLATEQEKISKLSHEIELAQREREIKAAQFYTNAAERAQNPNLLGREEEKYQQEIADKQKKLDDEKAKLSDMQDDARKAGAPDSMIEGSSGPDKN